MEVRISDLIKQGGYNQADTDKITNLLKTSSKYSYKVRTTYAGTVVEGDLSEIIEEVDKLLATSSNASKSVLNYNNTYQPQKTINHQASANSDAGKSTVSNNNINQPQKTINNQVLTSFPKSQTENNIGKILYLAGYTIIALGVVGSIILGNAYGYYEFNFPVFLAGVLTSGLSGLLIIALGEIINILHQSRDYLRELSRK